MSYNANIPQATDQISQSQPQILANFQALAGIAANTLPYLLVGPSQAAPAVDTTHMAIYSNTGFGGTQQMFIERQTGAPTPGPAIIEFTGANFSTIGWTRFPSGIMIKWGSANITGIVANGTQNVDLSGVASGPNYNLSPTGLLTVYVVGISTNASPTLSVGINSITNNNNFIMWYRNKIAGDQFYYLAIGY